MIPESSTPEQPEVPSPEDTPTDDRTAVPESTSQESTALPIPIKAEAIEDLLNDDLGELPAAVTELPAKVGTPASETDATETPITPIDPNAQIRLKTEQGKIWMLLPAEVQKDGSTVSYSWGELLQQLQRRLNGDSRVWDPETAVRLLTGDRLLDSTQLQELITLLAQSNLRLKRVYSNRRQTAIAAATLGISVEQAQIKPSLTGPATEPGAPMADPLYLQTTLRSGAEIYHEGSVIILGDMNPGSSVVAEGDILVWGKLRGQVHAGSKGNAGATIMATQMQPSQIRIADFVARGPSTVPDQFFPEVAYVTPQGKISIASASDFERNQ